MSIFSLHSCVVEDYRDFVRSFFTVADDRAREFIDHELLDEARLWPEALLQVSPSFRGETFRVLKEKETAKFSEYRTRRLVLEAWDRLGNLDCPNPPQSINT